MFLQSGQFARDNSGGGARTLTKAVSANTAGVHQIGSYGDDLDGACATIERGNATKSPGSNASHRSIRRRGFQWNLLVTTPVGGGSARGLCLGSDLPGV